MKRVPKPHLRLLLFFSLLGCPALAQDVCGSWSIIIIEQEAKCRWEGSVDFVQDEGRLTGKGSARVTAGRKGGCVQLLEGSGTGRIDGRLVTFGLATGALGNANFKGSLGDKGNALEGTWTTRSTRGTWTAKRVSARESE